MGERVTISYRGAGYELGRGRHSYGIWPVGAPRTEPLERWPQTTEGWNAAWSRFTGIEAPGTIVAASGSGGSGGLAITASAGMAAALLGIGVLCGIIGLFPGYLGGASIASQPVLLLPHAVYLGVWTLSAALVLLGGARRRAGALLAAGTSIVTFGLFFTDLGQVIAGGGHLADAGLWFSLVGWLAAAAGSAAAFLVKPVRAFGIPSRPRGYEAARAVLMTATGIGIAIAFAPSWDSYLLRSSTGTQWLTSGNAFSSPGAMIAGSLLVMIAFGLVVIVAALWRPLRLGAALLAGATIPMAAQAISGLIQASEPTSPTTFGISQSQASAAGLTITNGLTPAFWIFTVLVVALVVSCAWMLMPGITAPETTAPKTTMPETTLPDTPAPASAEPPAEPAPAWDADGDDIDWGSDDDKPDIVDSESRDTPPSDE